LGTDYDLDRLVRLHHLGRSFGFTQVATSVKHVPCIEYNVMHIQILNADNYGTRVAAVSLGKQR
jgi:hypothetical protein